MSAPEFEIVQATSGEGHPYATALDWATALHRSCQEVAALRGEPFDPEKSWAAIREVFTSPRRWNPADDIDGEHDDGMTEAEALAGADRLEARDTAWREGGHGCL